MCKDFIDSRGVNTGIQTERADAERSNINQVASIPSTDDDPKAEVGSKLSFD